MIALAIIERKPAVRGSRPREYVTHRLATAAEALTMAGILAARVELANEALARLAQLLYEQDTDGALANVDRATYRFLIPAPWGRSGHKRWGLRWHEADILRRVLLRRQRAWTDGHPPLYLYDEECRCWRLNLDDYGKLEFALYWLKRFPVVLVEWREVAQELAGRVRGR